MPNWNNYIMRKFGPSIKKKIAEAHDPFVKGVTIVAAHKTITDTDKTDMTDYAAETLDKE
jgi:hypothetical protein